LIASFNASTPDEPFRPRQHRLSPATAVSVGLPGDTGTSSLALHFSTTYKAEKTPVKASLHGGIVFFKSAAPFQDFRGRCSAFLQTPRRKSSTRASRSEAVLNNGVWHQGVYVNNGTNLQLFVDGQLVGTESYSPQVSTSQEAMLIGKEFPTNWGVGTRNFTGAIDDVRIYNRALSSNEVAQLFAIESQIPITYQWQFNGSNITGATSATLTVSNITQCNLGNYAVVVTNDFGSTTSSNASLSMYPFLATPFGGLDTYWGYTNTLSVQAWGTGPLSYQWYQNGAAIDGATNQTLTLAGIQTTNAGLYTVVVTSALGSVTNAPEQVIVNPAGVSVALYPGVTVQGVAGYTYIIQSTANLSDTNSWVTMTNLTLTQPIQLWMDTNTDASLPGNAYRFYRVLPGQ
jgi:hypothetical protein